MDAQLYHSELHGPMDADAGFSILLKWSHDEASFSTMTYTYQFPEQVVVADVERRILSDAAGPALAYSVAGNLLTVTYYAPAAAVEASFLLKAAWAPELGESAHIQWTPSTFTDVTFAKPELTVAKTMGEDGLRVMEDGTVWADYTVTVTNSGKVQAKEITFTDTLESQYFHFARGAFENGADYSLTVNTSAPEALSTEDETPVAPGAEQFLTFENYDGGNVLTFPAFDLAAGESRVFQYKASMSSEDRERVDEAVEAARETASAPVDAFAPMALSAETTPGMEPSASGGLGETVRNTASVSCPALGEAAVTATSVGTYGGPERKHVEDLNTTYHGETFDVTFVVNGDARLPAGTSLEKIDGREGNGFTLEIQKLPETDPDYITFAQALEEDGDSGDEEQLELQALRLDLRYNGVRLDLDDCEVTATVTPNEALKNYRAPKAQPIADGGETEEVLGDKGFGIELKAFTLEEQTDAVMGTTTEEVVESGSIYIDVPEETAQQSASASASAPVTVAVNQDLRDGGEPLTLLSAVPRMMASAGAETETATAVEDTIVTNIGTVATDSISFAVKNKMAVRTTGGDYPTYTVDFYAELKRLNLQSEGTDTTHVTLIDTRGKRLPTNALDQALVYVKTGADGVLDSVDKKQHIFNPKTISFNPADTLDMGMFNVLEQLSQKDNPNPNGEHNYELMMFCVTESVLTPNENGELTSLNNIPEDKIFKLGEKSADMFVRTSDETKNNTTENGKTLVYIPEGATITLIFKPTTGKHEHSANFYDYDISDGLIYENEDDAKQQKNGKSTSTQVADKQAYAYIHKQGINSDANYVGSGVKLAFGNVPTTGLNDEKVGGYNINQAATNVFRRCSFGIVTGYDSGKIVYNSKISAPQLFNEAENSVTGKTTYKNQTLVFNRLGDTYTMTAVRNTGAQNLETLDHQKDSWDKKLRMYSNEFWPMDDIAGVGKDGHDFKHGLANGKQTFVGKDRTGTPNTSDHPDGVGAEHNAFFGMQFDLEFTIPAGYVGPLDYAFFGDDDLWLFLEDADGNSQLICDIGGVHQVVGEYVDLRDYIPNGKAGTYKLHLFYTERGASGSCCWMQYTLPGIRSVPVDVIPGDQTGNLFIEKKLKDGASDTSTEFEFKVTLDKGSAEPQQVADFYNCTIFKSDGNVVVEKVPVGSEGKVIRLKAGEKAALERLVPGMKYTVSELDPNGAYEAEMITTTVTSNGSTTTDPVTTKEASGVIQGNTNIQVTFTNSVFYTLPETGGPGTTWYTYGVLPALVAAVVLYKRSRKKGGTVS